MRKKWTFLSAYKIESSLRFLFIYLSISHMQFICFYSISKSITFLRLWGVFFVFILLSLINVLAINLQFLCSYLSIFISMYLSIYLSMKSAQLTHLCSCFVFTSLLQYIVLQYIDINRELNNNNNNNNHNYNNNHNNFNTEQQQLQKKK